MGHKPQKGPVNVIKSIKRKPKVRSEIKADEGIGPEFSTEVTTTNIATTLTNTATTATTLTTVTTINYRGTWA